MSDTEPPLPGPDAAARCRIVVVDDSELQCAMWKMALERRFGDRVSIETYSDPRIAVENLSPDIQMLLLDWEMPGLDGRAVLEEARRCGVDLKRIVIASAHSADRLHEVFDSTGCLAVIEKEPQQLAICAMILDEIVERLQPARKIA
jgi:CheY-like chemotaxis protein